MKKIIAASAFVCAAALAAAAPVIIALKASDSGTSGIKSGVFGAHEIHTSPPGPTAVAVKNVLDGSVFEYSPDGIKEYKVKTDYVYDSFTDVQLVTVYSDDGREAIVRERDLPQYKLVGWSDVPPPREALEPLKNSISEYISGISGDWGVYVKRLDTNEYLSLNEKQYSGASLIKLFTMAAVYNEIAAKSISMTDSIRESLNLMITESSNIDCNELTKALGGGDTVTGFDVENRHTQSLGCANTVHESELVDGNGSVTFVGFNRTSPADCALILERIYRKSLVSEQASDEMLDMLKRQERTWKIPAALPEGTVTANKTGETDTAEADAAIVYSPACNYIICVIGNGSVSASGIENIKTISKMTYDYFNPQ